jgi:hypothetical protein
MGGVATGEPTTGNIGRAGALGRCDVRLNHPSPDKLGYDHPSPQFAGPAQGYATIGAGENAGSVRRLREFRVCNPGRHPALGI